MINVLAKKLTLIVSSTAVQQLVERNRADVFDFLIESGVPFENSPGAEPARAVYEAIRAHGSGSAVLSDSECSMSLVEAIVSGREDLAMLLISRGADVNAFETVVRLWKTFSPLEAACHVGRISLLNALIQHGAYVSYNCLRLALHEAVHAAPSNCNVEVVRRLLELGAAECLKTPEAKSYVGIVQNRGLTEVAHVLLDHGAEDTRWLHDEFKVVFSRF